MGKYKDFEMCLAFAFRIKKPVPRGRVFRVFFLQPKQLCNFLKVYWILIRKWINKIKIRSCSVANWSDCLCLRVFWSLPHRPSLLPGGGQKAWGLSDCWALFGPGTLDIVNFVDAIQILGCEFLQRPKLSNNDIAWARSECVGVQSNAQILQF